MSDSLVIGVVEPREHEAVVALLTRQHLPLDGLADHWPSMLVARRNGEVVGSAGLELYRDGALLRSVAVDDRHRGQGIGQALARAAIGLADAQHMPAVYLLTTTADQFFPRLGFERITRTDVPASVQTSVEFTSACPASAVVMRRTL